MLKTVLITGIGGDIGQGIATIIREAFPGWRILGMDIHDRHGGALFVDAVHCAPRVTDASYSDWLTTLIRRENIDVCVPMSEAELVYLSQSLPPVLGKVSLVWAGARTVAIGSDKLSTAEFLASIGIPTPWTIRADQVSQTPDLPCIFKARRSAGSKAVFVCHTNEEVDFYRKRFPSAVLQELLLPADQEVTCAVFRSQGQTTVLPLLRTLVGGFTGWAQVIDDPAVTEQCLRVANGLDLHGSINVQLRITAAGPRIFEINPRFSSTALMRHRMGFRDVVWSLQDVLGEPVTLTQPTAGTTAVRIQGAAVLEEPARGE